MKKNKKEKGFTLIEMLVVVSIIGLMTTMLIVSVSRIRKNSIDTRRKANIENVRGAITLYYSTKNTWPCISDPECATLDWSNLVDRLSTVGYLSDNIKTDEDADGTNDYYVCQCGTAGCTCPNSQMKLVTRFEVASNEDCSSNSTCSTEISNESSQCCALEVK